MAIIIGALEFEGPVSDTDLLSDEPGIYAVLCRELDEYTLVELAESDLVRSELQAHPQREHYYDEAFEYAVHYAPDLTREERLEIRDALETDFDVQSAA